MVKGKVVRSDYVSDFHEGFHHFVLAQYIRSMAKRVIIFVIVCCTISAVSYPMNLWVVSMCYVKPSMWTCAVFVHVVNQLCCQLSFVPTCVIRLFHFMQFTSSILEVFSQQSKVFEILCDWNWVDLIRIILIFCILRNIFTGLFSYFWSDQLSYNLIQTLQALVI